jgi:hypothetical protein
MLTMTTQSNHSPTVPPAAHRSKLSRKLTIAAAAVVVLLVVGWWLRGNAAQPPSPDVAPAKLAKYVMSPRLDQLPDEQRRVFMDALREDKDKLAEAYYQKKQIGTPEYETILLNIWISRALKHATDFSKVPEGAKREQFLDRIVKKGEEKRVATTRPMGSTIWDKDPYELDSVKRLVAAWPAERQSQWEDFRKALRARQVAKRVPPVSGIWY